MQIVLGLIIAFVLIAIFSDRKMRRCRWRQDRSAGQWRCAYCGAVVPDDGAPPKVCLAQK